MEFITTNYFNTTTMATISGGTLTVENMLYRDTVLQWKSDDAGTDASTTSIVFDFGSTMSVSRIGIMGMNIKEFDVFYDGLTASTLNMTTTSGTTTSQWSNNSESAMYLTFATIQTQSITLDLKSTQEANNEKAIGYLHFGDTSLVFPRIPSAKDYKPLYVPKEIAHKLSDGGARIQFISHKFQAQIKFKYIETSFRNNLFDTWKANNDFAFVAFGTQTGWDEVLHTVVWGGKFDFYKYSDNAPTAGFTGGMVLKEVT